MKNKTLKMVIASATLALALCACGQSDPGQATDTPSATDAASQQDAAGENDPSADTASSDASVDTTDNASDGDTAESGSADNSDSTDGAAADESTDGSDADATSSEGDAAGEDSPGSQRDLFADFIMGKINATTSDQYINQINMNTVDLQPGNEYSIDYIKRMIEGNDMIGDTQAKISYAPLDCGNANLFALRLYYNAPTEPTDISFVCADTGEDVRILIGIDSWSRRISMINEKGIILDSGANGAGSHLSATYAPDSEGIYHVVSEVEENYYGWDFYDENGSIEPLNTIIHEAGEGNEKAQDIIYYREVIDKKVYYYFLGSGKLTQSTVDYIDKIAASHDFKFDGKAAADEARTAYAQQLGIEEASKNENEPQWKDLN